VLVFRASDIDVIYLVKEEAIVKVEGMMTIGLIYANIIL
jgi:hypothetical protein